MVDAHGLYAETLGELGLVGLVLLVTVLAAILAGSRRGLGARAEPCTRCCLAAALAWVVAAAVDWHWEMPVVTLWLFAAGGAALASAGEPALASGSRGLGPPHRGDRPRLARRLPFKLFSSQASLDRADEAFAPRRLRRCQRRRALLDLSAERPPGAVRAARLLRNRRGHARQAIGDMHEAIDRDPNSWNFHYGLALARGSAGLDPRAEFRRAHDLNPLDVLTEDAMTRFKTDRPGLWQRRADELARRFTSL